MNSEYETVKQQLIYCYMYDLHTLDIFLFVFSITFYCEKFVYKIQIELLAALCLQVCTKLESVEDVVTKTTAPTPRCPANVRKLNENIFCLLYPESRQHNNKMFLKKIYPRKQNNIIITFQVLK